MDGNLIPYSQDVIYLGVTLDTKLHWNKHVSGKIKREEALLHKTAHLTRTPRPKILKWAWTGMIRPIVFYSFMIWAHKAESDTNKVKEGFEEYSADVKLTSRTKNLSSVYTFLSSHISGPGTAPDLGIAPSERGDSITPSPSSAHHTHLALSLCPRSFLSAHNS